MNCMGTGAGGRDPLVFTRSNGLVWAETRCWRSSLLLTTGKTEWHFWAKEGRKHLYHYADPVGAGRSDSGKWNGRTGIRKGVEILFLVWLLVWNG